MKAQTTNKIVSKKATLSLAIMFALPVMASSHDHDHVHGDLQVQGKNATVHTIQANNDFSKTLNWDDRDAFERNTKGLIVPLDQHSANIMRNNFDFISQDKIADSVNPSLYRQAQVNNTAAGLYEVTDGIYQVRGTDLSNITFIRGKTGWIVYDVLLTKQAAEISTKFFLENVPTGGDLPITAMIYSHSHADHFGGSRAIQEMFPNVKVYAPVNMTKEVVDENVLAGNAMSRRAAYQYGATLGTHEHGIVDAGLGKSMSTSSPEYGKGEITYVKPDYNFNQDGKFETYSVDGVEMIFIDTAGTEAPSGMATYIPSKKALWSGEMMYHGMHNIYTLRGAKVRDALKWSKDINEMINAWGEDIQVLFGSHSSPVWGQDDVLDFMKLQRDNYGFVHNQTLRLANNGVVLQDIGDAILEELPESIRKSWHTNGYHGSYSHNAKAVYNMYLGYFDMNPANLNPLPVQKESLKYVEYMGGSDVIVKKAHIDFEKGEYRFVATVLDKVVRAEPDNNEARKLLADTYEQLGYQSETMGWRNTYLTGAQELRVGTLPGTPKTASPDVLSEMTVENLLDYIAVRVDSKKAQFTPFSMNVVVPDTGEIYFVEMSNGNLSNGKVDSEKEADATLYLNKADITQMLLGNADLTALLKLKQAGIKGKAEVLNKLQDTLVDFDTSFEIVPRPAKGKEVDTNLYQHKH
ncbi:Metallo-beta-lactamase family protein [Vibrio nigripulchritudo MADA3029]|uniref:alkyl/aryl-sulfatase n=1 Tax=Vibrio nigripulchritudo TaxID=28173 RepID=UPI0003B22B90|nr:alkyl sulfatase dimerization domain-containing protein [Vibrio nigripulchritudo]CCN50039.1 Metallo-beta-lactamase family protein [Vibrio nigripulchritudo MADA3020]CCN56123.1 Metallo-beta-lactamase family protein [Vibrio nigripulchritudo MADA3021]CCN59044.1 Metallo-beta-lactamase family protein [Vibrio nigripulchritudo MADA3029]